MKKLALIAAAFVATTTMSFAVLSGSAHDFSGFGWSNNEICLPCHAPHNAQTANDVIWNHETDGAATYTVYYRAAMTNADPGDADSTSKLCLSCHDGALAVDSFGENIGLGTVNISTFDNGGTQTAGYADLGTVLTNDHPIGVSVTAAMVGTGEYKAAPLLGAAGVDVSGDVAVNCATCHDVHNSYGQADLLRISNTSSALCLDCHVK